MNDSGTADSFFGGRVRGHRTRLGWTQETLAARAGLSVRALREIERGRTRPQSQSRAALADALGLTGARRADLLHGRAPAAPTPDRLAVDVLGPLSARLGGQLIEIRSGTRRTVLGMLAIQPGYPITAGQIAETLWPGGLPAAWRNLVQVHVSRLRDLLEPGRDRRAPGRTIVSNGGAYRLDLDAEHSDLVAFDQFLAQAGQAAEHRDETQARRFYESALTLWRGPVLAGGDERLRQHPAVVALHRRRLRATLAHAELAIAADHPAQAVRWLRHVAHEEPLNEAVHAQLMLALTGSGEQAAAFELYAEIRTRLADELGVNPGPELQAAHRRILRPGAPDQAPRPVPTPAPAETPAPTQAETPARATTVVPSQLPNTIGDFVGRGEALDWLDRWLADPVRGPVVAIIGGAGVGKTTLAVHWARRVASARRAGQLYVNLNGYAGVAPVRPIQALSGFLRALGVAPERVPVDVAEAAALYRTLLAGRPMLVVLDNAHSSEQLRPLLAGGAGTVVVITSRDRLSGLAATHGVDRMHLAALPPDEAAALIGRVVGAPVADAEPEATAELARRCAYLPLALRIASANLTDRRYLRIADLVADLSVDGWPDALDIDGDSEASVRISFDNSYRGVAPAGQRLFRLLGLVPGPTFTEDVAIALVAEPSEQTRRYLLHLVDAHLVEQPHPGRYALHDLLRRYAVEACDEAADPAERRDALGRLYAHYAGSADAAARKVYPQILRLPKMSIAPAPPTRPALASQSEASAWLDAERHNLVAAVHRAEPDGFPEQTWLLADALRGYFALRRLMPEWLSVAEAARERAERAGDLAGQITARMSSAQALWGVGRHGEAVACLVPAVQLARDLDWPDAVASCLGNLGGIHGDWGRPEPALTYLTAARQVFRRQGTPAMTEANQLTNLGAVCHDLGRLDEAAGHNGAAMRLYRSIGALVGAAQCQANLGQVLMAQGQLERAARDLAEALDSFRTLGERHGEAATLIDLARLHGDLGARDLAERYAGLALQAAQEAKAPIWVSGALSVLGQVYLDPDLHRRAIQEAAGARYAELTALIGLAETLSATDLPYAADRYACAALAVARQAGYRLLEARTLIVLAQASRAQDRHHDSTHHARAALNIYRECGCPRQAHRAARLADRR